MIYVLMLHWVNDNNAFVRGAFTDPAIAKQTMNNWVLSAEEDGSWLSIEMWENDTYQGEFAVRLPMKQCD